MLLCPKTLRFSIQLLHRCILLQDCQCVLFALSETSKGAHNMLVSISATLMLLATDSPPHRLALPIRQRTHLPTPPLLATGIFRAAQKLYLLFQHHTTAELAAQQGHLFGGQNGCHCFLRQLGATAAVLGLDLRARRSSQGCCPPQVMKVTCLLAQHSAPVAIRESDA